MKCEKCETLKSRKQIANAVMKFKETLMPQVMLITVQIVLHRRCSVHLSFAAQLAEGGSAVEDKG